MLNILLRDILNKYKEAIIYLVGDKLSNINFKDKRVYSALGNAPYKQIILMSKYVDLVIGPETGLHVAAGMWGTPKIQFCNMSNIKQLCQHHKNDYSVQSECECSPCHRMVTKIFDCENIIVSNYELIPACVMKFNYNEIMNNVDKIYRNSNVCN